ncbi:Uncharacterized protein QTN25_003687 [Entamoeba marina]
MTRCMNQSIKISCIMVKKKDDAYFNSEYEKCRNYVNVARQEQYNLQKELEDLHQLYQKKQQQLQLVSQRKQLIKDRMETYGKYAILSSEQPSSCKKNDN